MKTKAASRRKFMMALGLGGAAAAAAALSGGQQAAKGTSTGEQGKTRGYRVTEHVRRYYETARV